MSDLIDRQKVLNTLDNMDKALDEDRTVEKYKELLTECIKVLPSAENDGDLISRQAVENITWEEPSYSDPLNVLTEVREKVRALPSVENMGEWIAQDIHNCCTVFKCSKCGYEHNFIHLYGKPTADYHYCPDCGARMKGGE